MSGQQLLSSAKNTVFHLKREERRSINPYASFADQVIGLINNRSVSSREEILQYTKIYYPRPRMNRQWRIFGNVLEKHLRSNMDPKDLLYFFGYLKRLLTIEGKKEMDEKQKSKNRGYGGGRRDRPHRQGKYRR
jgi:hypothetical protein